MGRKGGKTVRTGGFIYQELFGGLLHGYYWAFVVSLTAGFGAMVGMNGLAVLSELAKIYWKPDIK